MQEQKPMTTVGFFPNASTLFSPLTRPAGWVLFGLAFLTQKVGALISDPLYFTHNNNNYRLASNAANGTSSNNTIATSVFQAVANATLEGDDCGAVTLTPNPPTVWNASWTQAICDGTIELSRQASQATHATFEECEQNTTDTQIALAQPHCSDRKEANIFSIVAFSALAAFFTVLALALLFKCIFRCTAPSPYKEIENRRSPVNAGL